MGHVQQHPTKQMIAKTLIYRRKKKPSREPWSRRKVSGVWKNGFIQLNHPDGSCGLSSLEASQSMPPNQ